MTITIDARQLNPQTFLRTLSASQPAGITNKGGVSGTVSRAEYRATGPARQLERTAIAQTRANERAHAVAARDTSSVGLLSELRTEYRSLAAATANANSGVSLTQTAADGLDQIRDFLTAAREKAVSAADPELGDADRAFLAQDFDELLQAADDVVAATEYNDIDMLAGASVSLNVGTNGDPADQYALSFATVTLDALGLGSASAATAAGAQSAVAALDTALLSIDDERTKVGVYNDTLSSLAANFAARQETVKAAAADLRAADQATTDARALTLRDGSTALVVQANTSPEATLRLL